MRPWTVSDVLRGIAAAAGVAVTVVLGLSLLHTFDLFEASVWDLRARSLGGPGPATPQIDVVLVDQADLDWVQEFQGQGWPWPREYFGLVASFLARGGAKVTVFDVIFEQPSTLARDDQNFARALSTNGAVILAEAVQGSAPALRPLKPVDELAAAAAGLGHVRSTPDSDGINRRLNPWYRLADGTWVPSLALRAWSLGTGRPLPDPTDEATLLRYRGPQGTHRTWASSLLLKSEIQLENGDKPDLDPAVFRGHYVFFGYSAQGLLDLRPSPVDPKYPGVLVHATHLDNLLSGDSPRPLPWVLAALLTMAAALAAAWAVAGGRRAVSAAPVFVLALVVPAGLGWAAYAAGWWVPVVEPALAAVAAGLGMLLINYAGEGRQRRFIQSAFRQYLSPTVIEQLVQDPGRLKLGGEKRCLSIFFSDVAGFTSISENLDPVGLTSLLNDYLSEMTSIIYSYGGTIDKYEGDAIIAFWNAPLDLPGHALQAVRASLACQRRLDEIQPRLAQQAGRPVTARIGVNTGDVVIGNMGSSQRFNYTFLGDAGNLASRLEGINKQFGTRFLVSHFTKESAGEAPDLVWREISRVRVVGKSQPVTVFEPMETEAARSRADLMAAFDTALRLWYAGNLPEALAGFAALEAQDAPSSRYAERLRAQGLNAGPDWQGVWDAQEK